MTADDVRRTAQLVVDGRVHCVSDAAVEALARRVLELEADAAQWAIAASQYGFHQTTEAAVKAEREACAKLCDRLAAMESSTAPNDFDECAAAIRTRGGK